MRDPLKGWARKDTALPDTFSIEQAIVDRTCFGLQLVPVLQAAFADQVAAPVDKYATTGDSGHKGPGDQYASGPTYSAGTGIHIYCYVNGESITNSHYNDTTTVWDLSDDGYWYTDAWLFTNSNGPVVPACR